jgi:hypothetical protein
VAAALVLHEVVWFMLTVGMRTWIQVRRTGDSGFMGLGGRPGSVEWVAWITAIGLVAMVPNVVALVGLLVGVELQVRGVEERYLTQVHGEAYADYLRRVGRFIPGLGRA